MTLLCEGVLLFDLVLLNFSETVRIKMMCYLALFAINDAIQGEFCKYELCDLLKITWLAKGIFCRQAKVMANIPVLNHVLCHEDILYLSKHHAMKTYGGVEV
jgi:hypothetical protein